MKLLMCKGNLFVQHNEPNNYHYQIHDYTYILRVARNEAIFINYSFLSSNWVPHFTLVVLGGTTKARACNGQAIHARGFTLAM